MIADNGLYLFMRRCLQTAKDCGRLKKIRQTVNATRFMPGESVPCLVQRLWYRYDENESEVTVCAFTNLKG